MDCGVLVLGEGKEMRREAVVKASSFLETAEALTLWRNAN